MNWDALGAIAEIVASIGVIASLAYLAVQIRNQTIESSLASGNELANQLNQAFSSLTDNRDFASLFYKALTDFESLDPTDRVQFSSYMVRVYKIFEAMYFRKLRGGLDDAIWTGVEEAIRDGLQYPGIQSWWATRAHWFNDEYREYVSALDKNKRSPDLYGESQ